MKKVPKMSVPTGWERGRKEVEKLVMEAFPGKDMERTRNYWQWQ